MTSPRPPRPTLSDSYRILTPAERGLWRYPIMWAAALAFLFIPITYVGVYLMSVWDPAGNLNRLPAALVNLDQGTVSRGEKVNVGQDLMKELRDDPPVDFRAYPTQAAAEQAVRDGEVYFALTIPRDFSQKAVAGNSSEKGLMKLYRAPGLNYYASTVADRVATTIASELNATLGENRWDVVQTSLQDVQDGFADIRDATRKLADGAQSLTDGTRKLNDGAGDLQTGAGKLADGADKLAGGAGTLSGGVTRLTGGVTQLSSGLRQLERAAPGKQQLQPLRDGAAKLTAGATSLSGGLTKLAAGGDQLAAGAGKLSAGATQVADGNAQLAAQLPQLAGGLGDLNKGAQQLSGGAAQLRSGVASGLKPAVDGAAQLQAGAQKLGAGLGQAKGGAQKAADGAGQLAAGLPKLSSSIGQLQTGAQTLAGGAGQLSGALKGTPAAAGAANLQSGATQLAGGLGQSQTAAQTASSGAQQLATQLPGLVSGLGELQSGASQLQAGADKLAEGLTGGSKNLEGGAAQVQSGAQKLADGAASAQAGAQKAVTGAQQLAQGSKQVQTGAQSLQSGARSLADNTRKAAQGAQSLASGAKDFQTGVNKLADGNEKIKGALGQITAKLPAQKDLDTLSSGGKTLASSARQLANGASSLEDGTRTLSGGTRDLLSGAQKLTDGLNELHDKIPASIEQLGGDPTGLAESVDVRTTNFADAPNNGNAFAPYFIALALWVGATMTTFIFPYLLLPESGRDTRQVARVFRKLTHPLLIVLGQALIVVIGVHLMGVQFATPAQVILTTLAGSVTFLLVILALNLLIGPAGRILALVLLIVQLAASGGSYPVELSSPFFQTLHNVIPVTDVINALRHAMFGAFEGQYWTFMGRMGAVALVSLIVALLSRRRWVYTEDSNFRSPIITDVG